MAITDTDIGFLLMQRLAASTAIQALVVDRIRPMTLNENDTLPAIRYEILSTQRWNLLSSAAKDSQTRIQFDCYADSSETAGEVGEAVINRLDGFRGTLGSIFIHDCVSDDKYDRLDPTEPGGKTFRKRRTVDFVVTHTRPVPTLT